VIFRASLRRASRSTEARPPVRVGILEISADTIGLIATGRDLWRSRHLIAHLVGRDINGRYRTTFLGNWWVLLRPIVEMLPYLIVFGLFLNLRPGPLPYIVYLLSGFAPWLLFRACFSHAPNILGKTRSLITKIYFPRLIIPINGLILNTVDFLVALGMLLALALALGIVPTAHIWALPFFALLLLGFSFGAGLIVTAVCILRTDLSHGIPAVTRILFYMTPVVYPVTAVPGLIRDWYLLNPLTGIITGIRWSFFGVDKPSVLSVASSTGCTMVVLLLGVYLFLKIERRLADIL
jgi:lipopolysaccharide transport system permease protein